MRKRVHRYLVGQALIRADVRVIVVVVEIGKQVFDYVLGNIRIHKRRRRNPAGGKHLSYAQVLEAAAKLPRRDAEHKVKIVPPSVCLFYAGNLA